VVNVGQTPALIIIDMQNGCCHKEGFMNKIGLDYTTSAAAVEPISRLLESGRLAKLPIFYTRYTLRADYADAGLLIEMFPAIKAVGGLVQGTWDAQVVNELKPEPGDYIIDKNRYSAFCNTKLDSQLRTLSIDTLIVCGVTTNMCVESTVRDAFSRDIHVVVPSDGTAAVTAELHEGALRNFDGFGQVTTIAELQEACSALCDRPKRLS
jgi:ureidoacrylate peracid hydrolase